MGLRRAGGSQGGLLRWRAVIVITSLLVCGGPHCRKPPPIPEATDPQDPSPEGLSEFCRVTLEALRHGDEYRWRRLTESWLANKEDLFRAFPAETAEILWKAYEGRRKDLSGYRRRMARRVLKRGLSRLEVRPIPRPGAPRSRSRKTSRGERKLQAAAFPTAQLYQVRFVSPDTDAYFPCTAWFYANDRWRFAGRLWTALPADLGRKSHQPSYPENAES